MDPSSASPRGRFEPDGWAELHGCDVGAGVAGQRLLLELAKVGGVPAKAGRRTQHFWGGLEGQVIVVWPNGRFELRNLDLMSGDFALSRRRLG